MTHKASHVQCVRLQIVLVLGAQGLPPRGEHPLKPPICRAWTCCRRGQKKHKLELFAPLLPASLPRQPAGSCNCRDNIAPKSAGLLLRAGILAGQVGRGQLAPQFCKASDIALQPPSTSSALSPAGQHQQGCAHLNQAGLRKEGAKGWISDNISPSPFIPSSSLYTPPAPPAKLS